MGIVLWALPHLCRLAIQAFTIVSKSHLFSLSPRFAGRMIEFQQILGNLVQSSVSNKLLLRTVL